MPNTTPDPSAPTGQPSVPSGTRQPKVPRRKLIFPHERVLFVSAKPTVRALQNRPPRTRRYSDPPPGMEPPGMFGTHRKWVWVSERFDFLILTDKRLLFVKRNRIKGELMAAEIAASQQRHLFRPFVVSRWALVFILFPPVWIILAALKLLSLLWRTRPWTGVRLHINPTGARLHANPLYAWGRCEVLLRDQHRVDKFLALLKKF